MSQHRWWILGAALVAVLPACGSSSTTDAGTDAHVSNDAVTGTDVPAGTDAAGLPTVAVTSPAPNSNFPYVTATAVNIVATNFNLVDFPPVGGTAANDGHYHIYLDAADNNDYLFADYRPTAWVIIPPGTTLGAHTLRVSLRHYDHSAVGTPGADLTLPIMVTANTGPSLTITAPADNSPVVQGSVVNLTVTASNITLVEPTMQANNPAQGHYAVYLDGNSGSTTLTPVDTVLNTAVPVTIPGTTTVGPHRIRVSLRNNDNSPQGAESAVRISVTSM